MTVLMLEVKRKTSTMASHMKKEGTETLHHNSIKTLCFDGTLIVLIITCK